MVAMDDAVDADSPERSDEVFGISFYAGPLERAAALVVARAQSQLGGYVCLTSVHGLTVAQKDVSVKDALDGAWINFPDGMPILWLQRRHGHAGAERVSGADLMPLVLAAGQKAGLRHYLFGSTNDVLDKLSETIESRWPEVDVCGRHSPPFGSVEDHDATGLIDMVRKTQPDIVWVGLGAPKQDLWARQYAARLSPAVVIAVGAAFDFVSGTKKRAPTWMQGHGLEWTHRLASEPRRLVGRYAHSNSRFIAEAAREAVFGPRTRSR